MANENLEMMEAWKASKPALMQKALGLSDEQIGIIPGIYQSAWDLARKNRYAYPAAKARAEIAAKQYIAKVGPKMILA